MTVAVAPEIQRNAERVVANVSDVADRLASRAILVVGARGFLGQHLVAALVELNRTALRRWPCRILALDSAITAATKPPEDTAVFRHVEYDLRSPFEVVDPLDLVVHAAGIASPHWYQQFPLETIDAATTGTRHLLDLARRHRARLLFLSSSEVYGDPAVVPTPESYRGNVACHGVRAPYDESKRLGETLCNLYARHFETAATIARPFNVYGPGLRANDHRMLPGLAAAMAAERTYEVHGDGRQTRTFCHVSDAIAGLLRVLLLGRPGEAYNVGSDAPEINMLDLIARTERIVARPIAWIRGEPPGAYQDQPARRCPDLTRLRALGYEPRMSLDEGLAEFFAWALRTYPASVSARASI